MVTKENSINQDDNFYTRMKSQVGSIYEFTPVTHCNWSYFVCRLAKIASSTQGQLLPVLVQKDI